MEYGECRAKLRADSALGSVDESFEKRLYEYTYSPVKLEIKTLIGQVLKFCIHTLFSPFSHSNNKYASAKRFEMIIFQF